MTLSAYPMIGINASSPHASVVTLRSASGHFDQPIDVDCLQIEYPRAPLAQMAKTCLEQGDTLMQLSETSGATLRWLPEALSKTRALGELPCLPNGAESEAVLFCDQFLGEGALTRLPAMPSANAVEVFTATVGRSNHELDKLRDQAVQSIAENLRLLYQQVDLLQSQNPAAYNELVARLCEKCCRATLQAEKVIEATIYLLRKGHLPEYPYVRGLKNPRVLEAVLYAAGQLDRPEIPIEAELRTQGYGAIVTFLRKNYGRELSVRILSTARFLNVCARAGDINIINRLADFSPFQRPIQEMRAKLLNGDQHVQPLTDAELTALDSGAPTYDPPLLEFWSAVTNEDIGRELVSLVANVRSTASLGQLVLLLGKCDAANRKAFLEALKTAITDQ